MRDLTKKVVLKKPKKAQEEMVGFAIIVILVSIIILGILFFVLRAGTKQSVESYEVESFIQASLQYTTSCSDSSGNLTIRKLAFQCVDEVNCLDGRPSCDVLNETIKGILDASWPIENTPIKGYEFLMQSSLKNIIEIRKGNITNNYKGSLQDFTTSQQALKVSFKIYY
ncbi:MAG: hypothetical protein KatS3mg001_431 [Candidatus Pacearchaeota archaeon]|nr:MAG: hypothetical protein KatS3mg001_431 [Candidatus Pacearchaeota archaeon]